MVRSPIHVKRALATVAAAGLLGALILTPTGVGAQESTPARAAAGKFAAHAQTSGGQTRRAPSLSGGVLSTTLSVQADRAAAASPSVSAAAISGSELSVSKDTLGCSTRNSAHMNTRVNQDCTFRRQAEESIKLNPNDFDNLIAGQNDSRIGYNHCGFDYSFNGGKTWGDGLPPFFQRENHPENVGPVSGNPNKNTIAGGVGTAHTYDAASDPGVAFDADGRAFFSCVVFDVNTFASGLLVSQSPQGAGGSFYDNVPAGATASAANKRFVVVEDNSPTVFHDKPFITADAFTSSPNKNNVYATWTVFFASATCLGGTPDNPAFCRSPIYGSMSTDHGLSWSTPEEISGRSPLCFLGNFFDPSQPADACNNSQGSDPIVNPDGSLSVIFNNGNTAPTNPNAQQLGLACHPSGDSAAGTAHLNCGAPVKVGDDVTVGEPQCDFGRGPEECIPGPFIRTNDFPRIAVSWSTSKLFAVWQDYRNKQYDIQLSESDDGGKTWHEATAAVNPSKNLDHYMPAVDLGGGDHVAVSYYRSVRIGTENSTACATNCNSQPGVGAQLSNYFLAGGFDRSTPYADARVSPDFPPPDGGQLGFNGDYSGLIAFDQTAMPIWSDTRNSAPVTVPPQGVTHDEDIFTDRLPIPFP